MVRWLQLMETGESTRKAEISAMLDGSRTGTPRSVKLSSRRESLFCRTSFPSAATRLPHHRSLSCHACHSQVRQVVVAAASLLQLGGLVVVQQRVVDERDKFAVAIGAAELQLLAILSLLMVSREDNTYSSLDPRL